MEKKLHSTAPALLILIAFAIVYIVWGSTYFFIQMAIKGFPPMLMGALRYTTAGLLLLGWCRLKGDKLWVKKDIGYAAMSGLLMLFLATGIVIWVEQVLPSAMVAIMISSGPVWFVLLDKMNWKLNLKNRATMAGLALGLVGILLLFGEQLSKALAGNGGASRIIGMLLMFLSTIAWSAGSLYSKHHPGKGPARLNIAWQMIIAGLAFIPASLLHQETKDLHISRIPASSWMALLYLIFFGSLAAYSAYVWLLQVRPATQVSTHSYVNPVIAVLLGVLFAHETISLLQVLGLMVILGSVLLINLVKYRKPHRSASTPPVSAPIPQSLHPQISKSQNPSAAEAPREGGPTKSERFRIETVQPKMALKN